MMVEVGGKCPQLYLIFLFFTYYFAEFLIPTNASDSDHFFCGSTWDDASSNCDDRQHCPGGKDDECSIEGYICFGGTLCDSKLGHGSMVTFANVDYNDISNTRFCGTGWNAAKEGCSIETHCPSGFSDECPAGQSCYGGLDCNVQDFHADDTAAKPNEVEIIGKDDERRNMFCGMDWNDANEKCNIWCPGGQDEDCPGELGCFGNTECYSYGDLKPTSTPVLAPTMLPSTMPPVPYDDPGNNRFCGFGWGMALENCSLETHCPGGNSDCPTGQFCHEGLPSPQCNIVDLWEKAKNAGKPSPHPTKPPVSKDDPRNTKFCGQSWALAEANCSLETHCPDDQCPSDLVCYGGTSCSAFDMTRRPTKSPTLQPTQPPTLTVSPFLPLSPTSLPSSVTEESSKPVIPADDIRHSYWCGRDWDDVTENCFRPCTSGQDKECSDSTMKCIAFTSCRPGTKPSNHPTKEDTQSTTPQPSLHHTEQRTTLHSAAPANASIATYASEVPISSAPSIKPISDHTTNEPTATVMSTSDEVNSLSPTNHPSPIQTYKPTFKPAESQTNSPTTNKVSLVMLDQAPPPILIAEIGRILISASSDVNEKVLLSLDSSTGKQAPTQRYIFGGFINALGIISKGNLGSSYFYLGRNGDPTGFRGLVNIALIISQAVVEAVKYDICDDVSWEKDVFGRYPLANSCGQGRFSGVTDTPYDATNQCTDEESFVACPVDPAMTTIAESKVTWAGAPPPLKCFPTTNNEATGAWDSNLSCTEEGCIYYDGQVKGNIDPTSVPSSNSFGKNNVEGCCWWGRGPFPRGSAGTCMIGKLNYYLGKRAQEDGRSSVRYKELDFCKDPGLICRGYYDDKEKNAEIRWLMGMLYWIRNVQAYNKDGFSFIERLDKFVDSGLSDLDFFADVSRIVARGCHLKSCGEAISVNERKRIFDDILLIFANVQTGPSSSKKTLSPTTEPSTKEPASTARRTDMPTTQQTASRPTPYPTIPPILSTTSKSNSTFHPTSKYISDEITNLSKDELEHRFNFPNNYCATNLNEAESKCATSLRTCNFGQPLCSVGQACFGNILCAAAAPFLTQTVEKSSITCGHTCLRPLSSRECAAGSSIGAFDSLPNCLNVDVGELCESNGECGDAFTVNNCPGGKDVFMRVDECTHTSNDSITTTGFETASENQNQTATIESSNEPSPNESTEHQNSEKGGNDSLINSWWRDEISAASIMSNALLQYSFYILRILLNILT